MSFEKYSKEKIKETVFGSLTKNISYNNDKILGVPASFLDREVFYKAAFLKDAPYMSCLLENPNHIGCHTRGESEAFFTGTQELERDLLGICAHSFLKMEGDDWDGYVATGGTEANIQAMWVYRNFFMQRGATPDQIAIVHSEDTHYSVYKGANLLGIQNLPVPVDSNTRQIHLEDLSARIDGAIEDGVTDFIFILNMGTTMFGSVDDIGAISPVIDRLGDHVRIHVDAAFGGFIYPVANPDNPLTFRDARISSFTMDAHKMLQAPYGTGIFIIRRPYMDNVRTEEASYVHGQDNTLAGSRSGANAVAVWMILRSYGSDGAVEFLNGILALTHYACERLEKHGVDHFRDPHMNIITIKADAIKREVAEKYFLVPDNHDDPKWWKIVVMDHITVEVMNAFLSEL